MPAAPSYWQRRGLTAALLFPLSLFFRLAVSARRALYRYRLLPCPHLPVPVVVVGNIAVGGSGKTPVVLWLVARLKAAGFHPGIVSRGYGGWERGPFAVEADTEAFRCGDEPILLARRAACPVWIGRDRVAAVRAMCDANPQVNVVVSDDGLQHYRMARVCEMVVLDPQQLGNRWLLPAGPLREPLSRLAQCDLVLAHGGISAALRAACPPAPVFAMRLEASAFYALRNPRRHRAASEFAGLPLKALAGIGRPQRFFDTLAELGLELQQRVAFPDHHEFTADDVVLGTAAALLVTEKDAVKLDAFAPPETWVLPVEAQVREGAFECVMERLNGSKAA